MDRLIDLLLSREPKGDEKALLEAAKLPLWVRLAFVSLYVGALCVFILSLVHKAGWVSLPWPPMLWPQWIVFFGLLMVANFAYREVHRQYGKRALREDQTPQ